MCQSLTCSVLSSRRTTDPTNEYVLRQPPASTDSADGGAFRSIKQDCDFGLRVSGVRPSSATIGTDLGEEIRPTQLRRRLQHVVSLILRFLHAVPPRPSQTTIVISAV